MKLKILKGLATEACFLREKRNSYETNRALKAFGLWVLLKNETTSGFINDPHKQSENLEKLCKASFRTIRRYVSWAEDYGLIRKSDQNGWALSSYSEVCDKYLLKPVFTEFEYDETDEKKTIEYYLKALEIAENREKQIYTYNKKQKLNPQIKPALEVEAANYGKRAEAIKTPEDLFKLQKQLFSYGGSHSQTYNVVQNFLNPDFQRSARTIRKAHKFKSVLSVTYMKRQLEKRGFATIEKRSPVLCNYKQNGINDEAVRGRKANAGRRYRQDLAIASWFMTDKIQLNAL